MRSIISDSAPDLESTYDTCSDWLAQYNTTIYRSSIQFKGPLIFRIEPYSKIITEYREFSIVTIKNHLKIELLKTQSTGDSNEWGPDNITLNNIPGLRKSNRI